MFSFAKLSIYYNIFLMYNKAHGWWTFPPTFGGQGTFLKYLYWNVPSPWTLPIVKQQAIVMEPKQTEIMRHKQGSFLMSTG